MGSKAKQLSILSPDEEQALLFAKRERWRLRKQKSRERNRAANGGKLKEPGKKTASSPKPKPRVKQTEEQKKEKKRQWYKKNKKSFNEKCKENAYKRKLKAEQEFLDAFAKKYE